MAAAARVHIVEKGRDPRRYAMVAFGGAGPAHAARVARILGIAEVIVPPASGAAAALGFLVAPISFEFVTSLPGVLGELDLAAVNRLLGDLEAQGRTLLAEAGVPAADVAVARVCSVRCTTSPCRSRRALFGLPTSPPSRAPSSPSTRGSTPTSTPAP
jgi:5-oxoprolinase (ATP-hydrolysing)/N-methylhydantoinase A